MSRALIAPRPIRFAPVSVLAVLLAALVAAFAIGCASSSGDGAGGANTDAPAVLWFAQSDGTTVARASDSSEASLDAAEAALTPPAADAFATRPGGGGRQLAYDREHGRLWYSDNHATIASIDLQTGAAGPVLGPFSDIALWGCAVNGRARTFAVDAERNRLLVSSLGGGLVAYDLESGELVGGIGPNAMGDVAFDFRRLAIDEASDTLWFSTYTGAVAALDLDSERLTGATVELTESPQAISIDAGARRMLVLEAGQLTAVDLDTLAAVSEAAPEGAVALTFVTAR